MQRPSERGSSTRREDLLLLLLLSFPPTNRFIYPILLFIYFITTSHYPPSNSTNNACELPLPNNPTPSSLLTSTPSNSNHFPSLLLLPSLQANARDATAIDSGSMSVEEMKAAASQKSAGASQKKSSVTDEKIKLNNGQYSEYPFLSLFSLLFSHCLEYLLDRLGEFIPQSLKSRTLAQLYPLLLFSSLSLVPQVALGVYKVSFSILSSH